MDISEVYVDEDRALGFHVWVAELELLVGTARGRSIDQVAAFELLQKVLVNIVPSEVDRVREYQRRCELALMDILLQGAASPVRRLVCLCTVELYAVGDSLPMYARVGDLQAFLSAKEAKGFQLPIRLGALQCLAALCERHGRMLATSMADSLAVAMKFAARGVEVAVRAAALDLVAKVVTGLGPSDRTSLTVQTEAVKCALRVAKEPGDAASTPNRLAAASILRAVAGAEGAGFWSNPSWYEEAVKLSVGLLEDDNRAVADAFAGLLGDLAAASHSQAAKDAVKVLEKKASKKAALEQLLKESFRTCLVAPWAAAMLHGRQRASTALAQSWLVYIRRQQAEHPGDDEVLVELAARALEVLGSFPSGVGAPEEGEPELGWALSGGEMPHAQACVLYVLRAGVIESLGEAGQRSMLDRLSALLASVLGGKAPLAVATLEAMGLLLEVLGEIPGHAVEGHLGPMLDKLTGESTCLRHQAAGVLAALASAEHSSAAKLLEGRLDSLAKGAASLALACGTEPASNGSAQDAQLPGTPRGIFAADREKIAPLMNAVHGNSLGVAALLVATARLPLGVPSKLPAAALDLAEQLITMPGSKRSAGRAVEREAGYILLGALCVSLPLEVLLESKQKVVQLWQPALAAESVSDLDLRKYLTMSQARAEVGMASELWWRGASLEAFKALLLSPLVATPGPDSEKLQRRLAAILQPTLAVVLASPVLQDPTKAKGVLGASAGLFQVRLLEAYLALPNPNAFASEHQDLSRLCTRAFRGSPSTVAPGATGVAHSAASSTLRLLLNRQDAPLGPWLVGRGPLDDALQAFSGAPGGPPSHPWEAGLPFSSGYAGVFRQLQVDYEPFPQPKSLSAALLERQLVLLGSLLAVVSEANQVQILDVMLAAATVTPPRVRGRDTPLRREAALTSICCTALAGLDTLARKYQGEVESRDAVAERTQQLAEAALAEGISLGNVALLRSSAEMFALTACIGSEAKGLHLLRTLCTDVATSPAPSRRVAVAVALGCIYRSKGGIALRALVGHVAGTLLAVARASSGPSHIWLLHALWLVANSAGLSFIPNVKEVLDLETELLMAEGSSSVPGLRPVLGRLANAMVAVLGPEMGLGSPAYTKTRTLLLDLQYLGGEASSAEEATMAELERVLYAQMLILFAPHAVAAASHLPLLLATLHSRQPALRKAAADTLRHLAERDPEAILPTRIETLLFGALDSETDVATAAQLKATIHTLLAAGAAARPSHYLATCTSVILAATAADAIGGVGKAADTLQEDEDSDEEDLTQVEARRSSHSAASTSGVEASERAASTTRLRTRAFAAACLLDLPNLVGSDPRHFNPLLAQDAGGDWLVSQVQSLVDMAFRMTTGSTEALRSSGLLLLKAILLHYGNAQDPLLDSCRLLEQYQAQFLAALRSSLSSQASPVLAAAGASLAADFVRAGLTQGDTTVLARLVGMLTDPLAAMQAIQEQYADWVGAQAKVALLEANAICVAHLLSSGDDASLAAVSKAHRAHSGILQSMWLALLQDWLILTTQPLAVRGAYKPRLLPSSSPSLLLTLLPLLQAASMPVLTAACALLSSPSEEEGGQEEAPLTMAGYHLLLEACHLCLAEAASQDSRRLVGPGEVVGVLGAVRCLLGEGCMRPTNCDMVSCCNVVSWVAGLLKQGALDEGARVAAAKVLLQACCCAPEDYMANPTVVKTLAAAVSVCLEACRGLEGKLESPEAAAVVMAAGRHLLERCREEAKVAQAGLLVQSLHWLQPTTTGAAVEAAAKVVLPIAQAAAAEQAEEGQGEDAAGVSPQEPPSGASLLACAALGTASQLSGHATSAPKGVGPDLGRLRTVLDLLLSLGPLLPPANPTNAIPLLQLEAVPPPPPPAVPAPTETLAAQAAPSGSESDGWDDEGFQEAESQDQSPQAPPVPIPESAAGDLDGDGWEDEGFQEAEPQDQSSSPLPESTPQSEGAAGILEEDDWEEEGFQEASSQKEASTGPLGHALENGHSGVEGGGLENEAQVGETSAATPRSQPPLTSTGTNKASQLSNGSPTEKIDGRSDPEREAAVPVVEALGEGRSLEAGSQSHQTPLEASRDPEGGADFLEGKSRTDMEASSQKASMAEVPGREPDGERPAEDEDSWGSDFQDASAGADSPIVQPDPTANGDDDPADSRAPLNGKLLSPGRIAEPQQPGSTAKLPADDVGAVEAVLGTAEVEGSGRSGEGAVPPAGRGDPQEQANAGREEGAGTSEALPPASAAAGIDAEGVLGKGGGPGADGRGALPAPTDDSGGDGEWDDEDFQAADFPSATAGTVAPQLAPSAAPRASSRDANEDRGAGASQPSGHHDGPSADARPPTSHTDDEAEAPQVLKDARERCLDALKGCLGKGVALAVHGEVLRAVRAGLQAASATSSRQGRWGLSCCTLLAPLSAANVHAWSTAEADADLADLQNLVASETLKLLSSCLPLAAETDARLEESLLTLLVQLLVVCAAPQNGAPQPALREVVSRLMGLLAGGPSGAAFRRALVSLPVHQRQKLQGVLQAGQAKPEIGRGKVVEQKTPGIALKTFAVIAPKRPVAEKAPSLSDPDSPTASVG